MADSLNEIIGKGTHGEDADMLRLYELQDDDAASATVVDSSSAGVDGTLTNAGNTSAVSTTGPGGRLAKAFDLDGVNDYVTSTFSQGNYPFSICAWVNADTLNAFQGVVSINDTAETNSQHCLVLRSSSNNWSAASRHVDDGGTFSNALQGTPASTWTHIAGVFASATSRVCYVDGVAGTPNTDNIRAIGAAVDTLDIGRLGDSSPSSNFDGKISGIMVLERAMTAAEIGYHMDGLEPLNTAAPSLSGTETEDETLTCSTGTWNDQSEGSPTFEYQWTRSNDAGGTGEANIGGATSSTYTLVTADVGKFIRCRVRGLNPNGGFDSAEDANSDMSGAIAAASSDTLTISTPVQYFTNQRSGTTGSISITGTYSGTTTPTAIEASFNGGAYATIDASPSAGTFSGTLSSQAQGQGTLTVRFTNATGVNDTVADVGIGDVFLVAGQSNAAGRATNNQSYSGTLKATMFREDDAWAELADPTESGSSTGSAWPILATEILADQTGVPIAFITTAEGSTRLVFSPAGWAEGNTNYNNAVQQVADSGVDGIAGILWYQGEGDAFGGISQSAYNAGLDSLIASFRSEGGAFSNAVLICAQIGEYITSSPTTRNNAIRAAQAEAWDDNANIYAGPVTYDVDLSDSGGDGVHFKTDAEMATLGRRWWFAVEQAIYSGTEGRGPKVSSATLLGRVMTVTFDKTLKTGLTLAAGAWDVDDDGSPATIDSIGYTPGSTTAVDLILSAVPTGPVTVTLGNANDAAGLVVPTGADQTIASSATDINLPAEPMYAQSVTITSSGGSGAPRKRMRVLS